MIAPGLWDADLEAAFAQQAVYRYPQFVALGVTPEMFYTELAGRVVRACAALAEEGREVSTRTVVERLTRGGLADALERVLDLETAWMRRECDVGRLRELYRLRLAFEAGRRTCMLANQEDLAGAVDAMGEGHATVMRTVEQHSTKARHLVERTIEDLMRDSTPDLHPGFEGLRRLVGDIPPQTMTLIGGNTSVGKSSFVLEMMLAASKHGTHSAMLSVEDPEIIMGRRLLSMLSGVSSRQLQMRAGIDNDKWTRIARAAEQLHGNDRMEFVELVGGTDMDVCAAMSRVAANGAKLVFVDYIGVVRPSSAAQDRRNAVSDIAIRLKAHAIRLNVALVLVSQFKRPENGNPNTKPTKHSFKESGDLENGAEMAIGLWREKEDDSAVVHAEVLKCKWGGTGGTFNLQRQFPTMRLEEL